MIDRATPAARTALVATGTTFALGLALASPWPDDWDAVGFVRAVTDFDLARFQPHPPGYPVYVALCRAANLLARDPVRACGACSALGLALAVWALTHRSPSRMGVACAAVLALSSPELMLAATSARSDALGLGFVALSVGFGAFASRARDGALAGAMLALGTGARPSLAVCVVTALALGAVKHRARPRVWIAGVLAFGLVCVTWLAGLVVASGGVETLVAQMRRQAAGHFGDWGGSVLTRPDAHERALAIARGIFGHGLGLTASLMGALRGFAWAALTIHGARKAPPRARWIAALVLPYALYAAVAQNVFDSPRHLLPVVLAVIALAAWGAEDLLARVERTPVRWSVLAGVAVLVALPAVETAWVHRTREPPGVLVARYVETQGARDTLMLFGGRSARVAEWAGVPALPRTLMGEVDVTLERFDRLPRVVFVTDEVRGRERGRGTLYPGRRFCRDARVDHTASCVTVHRYDILTPRDVRR